MFCGVVLSVLSSFTIISSRKRELVAFLKLSFCCRWVVCIVRRFFEVACVGLRFVIVASLCYT